MGVQATGLVSISVLVYKRALRGAGTGALTSASGPGVGAAGIGAVAGHGTHLP